MSASATQGGHNEQIRSDRLRSKYHGVNGLKQPQPSEWAYLPGHSLSLIVMGMGKFRPPPAPNA